MRCRIREVVIYFKFHENRSRRLGAVEGRKSPSPIDKAHAHTTACTTVQAVMFSFVLEMGEKYSPLTAFNTIY